MTFCLWHVLQEEEEQDKEAKLATASEPHAKGLWNTPEAFFITLLTISL